MNHVSSLSTVELARHCAEETENYYRRSTSNTAYCFELLRRACQEQSGDAFAAVYQTYQRFVMHTVLQHPRFPSTGESAEFFTNGAFRAFYVALRGPGFDRLSSLPAALKYLKACAYSSIAMYLRGKQGLYAAPIEEGETVAETADIGEHAEVDELWQRVLQLLPNENDRLLARLAFVLQYRPREICQLHPTAWPTERSASVALFRIRTMLRKQLLGWDDEPEAERQADGM